MRMEGSDGWSSGSGLPTSDAFGKLQLMADPLLHFQRGFVGKRHGQNPVGLDSVPNQVGHPERNHPCFSSPSPRQYQKRTG